MKTSDKGIEFIKRHEALRLNAYLDSAGVPTIGYGHTLGVRMSDTITKSQAEQLLRGDLITAESEINKHNLNINQNQFDSLVSFVFNLGVGNFARSTLLRKIKSNPNDPAIRKEFEKWIYAGGKVLNGLVRRRREEADLYFMK